MKFKAILFFFISIQIINAHYAIVIKPVTDLIGQPLEEDYHAIPWSAVKNDHEMCPRIFQLLFNEIVEVIQEHGNQIKVRTPHAFYQTASSNKKHADFWMQKNDVVMLDQLHKSHVNPIYFPPPLIFNQKKSSQPNNTVSLIRPYHDRKTQTTYSMGTRFVKQTKQSKKNKVFVYVFNPKQNKVQSITLPKSICWEPKQSCKDRLHDFVAILKQWAHQPGTIPYLWGGASFCYTLPANNFSAQYGYKNGKKLGYYTRPSQPAGPKSGLDCSSIILRAAQIAGIPYYYRNTYTLMKNLPDLHPNDKIKLGDLIWVNGHVLIVSDIEQNRIIQACSYDDGYGKVFECSLDTFFKDIKTFDELKKIYAHTKPVERINSRGQVSNRYKSCKILTMQL